MISRKDLTPYEKNLISFLKLFQNRPLHLAQYLIDNDCLNDDFKNSILESKKLIQLSEDFELNDIPNVYFLNFKEMLKFFESISNEYNLSNKNDDQIYEELNSKLEQFIKQEKYEDAIKIRDYMIRNDIKRKS
jgi:hypothetical protein